MTTSTSMLRPHWLQTVVAALGMMIVHPSMAQEPELAVPQNFQRIEQAAFESRVTSLEQELASLRTSLGTEPGIGTCDSCGPCDDGCEGGLTGGFSFVFLKPRFQDNRAFTVRDSTGFPNEFNTKQNFDYDYEITPRMWLGWMGPTGAGARVRYWQFDHGSDSESFTDPGSGDFEIFGPFTETATGRLLAGSEAGPGDTVYAISGLDAYTIDAEVVQKIEVCHWRIDLGGGFRHAGIGQDYTAAAVDSSGDLIAVSAVRHRFDGVGPTIFTEVHRQVGSRRLGLAVFALGRASILWGNHKYRAVDSEFGAFTDTAAFGDNSTLRIGEIQVGGEWLYELPCGSIVFAQLGWEAQIWEGSGNASSPTGDDLGLTGFHITAGLTR